MPVPVVTREGIRMALTKPPVEPGAPPVEDIVAVSLPETLETPIAAIAPTPKDTETEPAMADTQQAEKFKSPPPPVPPPSSSIPPAITDLDDPDD